MYRLGLTGGIGSGKSTVAQMLVEEGAGLIDADAIARQVTAPGGAAIPLIAERLGSHFVTSEGALDRDQMRAHVFSSPAARRALESIVHPLVQQDIARQAEASTANCLVFDIPLLVEAPHWRAQLDKVLVVDCTEATQIDRVMQRNGWQRSQVEAIVKQQSPRYVRLAAADCVLNNEGPSLTTLRSIVQQLARRLPL